MACVFSTFQFMYTRLFQREVTITLLVFLFICLFLSPNAHAQVTLNTNANINFGTIDFADSHNGNVQLGTNGTVQTTGFGLSARDNGHAGRIKITEPDTGIVDVKCASTGELTDAIAPSLNIQNIEVSINTGLSFSNGTSCQGLLPADPVTISIDMDALPPDPDVLVGGEITINNVSPLPADRIYSTSGSGTPIRLSIVVQ